MNLRGDFFNITSMHTEGKAATAMIELNAFHQIFEGHFPGMPVVPGVCMIQMVKEVIENVIGKEIRLLRADVMKFLLVINPRENKMIEMELKYNTGSNGSIDVSAAILVNKTVCFKFKGSFIAW